ncbi:hypothetical protein PHMEG_00019980 [Phytophthora megakarya]|uniref:Uncharacterized protein n=1 Tax=Phytophthora megakarya TaxID=4795 RepID=A0A225VS44_9STRA|nr:hypothetical protein PHMEG_00019980 [Phytophthora megakarya]
MEGEEVKAFLAIGFYVGVQDQSVQILDCDGIYMKSPQSNGVCIQLFGQNGEWDNIPAAVDFIHNETAENFE